MQLSILFQPVPATTAMAKSYVGSAEVRKHNPEKHYQEMLPPDLSYMENWADVLAMWEKLWTEGIINDQNCEWAILQKGGKWNGKVMISAVDADCPKWTPKEKKDTNPEVFFGEFWVGEQASEKNAPEEINVSINLEIPISEEEEVASPDIEAIIVEPELIDTP